MVTILLFLALGCLCNIYAAPPGAHYGREFYFGMIPARDWSPDFTVDIASQKAGTVYLSIPYLNVHRNQSLNKGSTTLTVSNALIRQGTFTENRGVYLRTDVPVAVYVTWKPQSTVMDTFLAFPASSLVGRYTVASYDPCPASLCSSLDRSAMMIIAALNDTTVTFTSPYGGSSSRRLDTLDIYQQESRTDISHTKITSDKPVTVISGTSCAFVPHGVYDCDLLLEQMIPEHAWDKTFIAFPIYPKTGYLLRIFPTSNATVCLKNNTATIYNNVSHIKEEYLMGTDPVVVTSNEPISLVQYGVGQRYDEINGDEFMTVIPGLNNYLNSYYFVIPNTYSALTNSLAIAVLSTEVGGLLLDGSPLVPGKMYSVPDPLSNYTVLIISITTGYHELIHTNEHVIFGVTAYGLDSEIGYGFSVGFGFSSEKYSTTLPTTAATSTTASTSVPAISSATSKAASTTGPTQNTTDVTCYSCDDLSNVELCDVVKHCHANEICYIKRHVKYGRTLYQAGCMQAATCLTEMDIYQNIPDRCVECCSQSYCNNKGCGDEGLAPRNQRGPLCYDCPYEQSPKDCNKLSLCEQHEVCSIEEFKWGEQSHYIMGCSDDPCTRTARSVHMATRALPVCRSCCTDDYCNLNCTRADETPTLVGKS